MFETPAKLFSIPKYNGMLFHKLQAYANIKAIFCMCEKPTLPKGMQYIPFHFLADPPLVWSALHLLMSVCASVRPCVDS